MKQLLKKIFCKKNEVHIISPGETEFDYIPLNEVKKKSTKKEKVIIHPKVKVKS